MATIYKAYENEDGTVEFVKAGSIADQGFSAGSEDPGDVPGLEQSVPEDGSKPLSATSFVRAVIEGALDINTDEGLIPNLIDRPDFLNSELDWDVTPRGIVVNFEGIIEVTAQVGFWMEGTTPIRSAPHLKVVLDEQEGRAVAKHTYIRAASGHNNSSAIVVDLFEVRPGQIVNAKVMRGAASGVVNLEGESSFLYVKRLK